MSPTASESRTASETRTRPGATSASRQRAAQRRKPGGRRRIPALAWVAVALVGGLAGLWWIFTASQAPVPAGTAAAGGTNASFPYAVGDPGPGEPAVPFELPSTAGDMLALEEYRGETVLLYFQEGLMCQPCWDQMRDIEARWPDLAALDIDSMVTVTTDPIDALRQKVQLEGLERPVVSDPDLAVSRAYDTNAYGMMGDSRNGHTFMVVGPDGEIRWRADYGGAPKFTMFVPVDVLVDDLRRGLDGGGDAA